MDIFGPGLLDDLQLSPKCSLGVFITFIRSASIRELTCFTSLGLAMRLSVLSGNLGYGADRVI